MSRLALRYRQRFFYWEPERGRVSWFPPQHPRAVLTMPAAQSRAEDAAAPSKAGGGAAGGGGGGGDKRARDASSGRKTVGFGGVGDEDEDEPPAKKDARSDVRAARSGQCSSILPFLSPSSHNHYAL